MVSKMAKQMVERWKAEEGLVPSFDDVVRLNALGLKVERGGSSFEFGCVPRMAFLGDWILTEPTVGKRIWLDAALKLMESDYFTQVCVTAYALNTPDAELPDLRKLSDLVKAVGDFKDSVLMGFTVGQILAAIEYALRGDDPAEGEECECAESNPSELPPDLASAAKTILVNATSYGIDLDCCQRLTIPELERAVVLAAVHSGVDVMKGEHAQTVGAFYAEAGRIHGRLVKERDIENGTNDGGANG